LLVLRSGSSATWRASIVILWPRWPFGKTDNPATRRCLDWTAYISTSPIPLRITHLSDGTATAADRLTRSTVRFNASWELGVRVASNESKGWAGPGNEKQCEAGGRCRDCSAWIGRQEILAL